MSLPKYSEVDSSQKSGQRPDNQTPVKCSGLGFDVDTQDLLAHLKLLKAFSVHKQLLTKDVPPSQVEKFWQCYLTRASRNFILFISALKYRVNESSERLNHYMGDLYPPLDVLLVWHTFLQNPRASFHEMKASRFLPFLKSPFPLTKIAAVIDNDFKYVPARQGLQIYRDIINAYMNSKSMKEEYEFDSYARFEPDIVEWNLYCPGCSKNFGKVGLNHSSLTSDFASPQFKLEDQTCKCTNSTFVDHSTLRFIQFLKDSTDPEARFISVFEPSMAKLISDDTTAFGERIKSTYGIRAQVINDSKSSPKTMPEVLVVLMKEFFALAREYLSYNLIHATLPPGSVIQIHEDLVAACLRQERFNSLITKLDWIGSQFCNITISEAIERYKNFAKLIKKTKDLAIPTLDIDLVWHTHQLNQLQYFVFSQHEMGRLTDHNDKIEVTRLDEAFHDTCKSYKKMFKEDYSVCPCTVCSSNKVSSRSIFEKSRQGRQEYVKTSDYGLSHISDHNAVSVDTPKAKHLQDKIVKKYNVNSIGDLLCFQREKNPNIYVVPYISLGLTDADNKGFYARGGDWESDTLTVGDLKGTKGLSLGTNFNVPSGVNTMG